MQERNLRQPVPRETKPEIYVRPKLAEAAAFPSLAATSCEIGLPLAAPIKVQGPILFSDENVEADARALTVRQLREDINVMPHDWYRDCVEELWH